MQETMTSRERLRRICDHREADRVPIDCGAMHSSALSAITFNRVTQYLGMQDEPCFMHDTIQQLALTRPRLRKRFHVDVIDLAEAFIGDAKKDWKPWELPDGSKCFIPAYVDFRREESGDIFLYDSAGYKIARQPKSAFYCTQIYHPYDKYEELPETIDMDEISHHMWRTPAPPFQLDLMNNEADYQKFVTGVKEYRKNSDDALMLVLGCSLFEESTFIRGLANVLMDYAADEAGINRLLDAILDRNMRMLERILAGVGEDIDVLVFSDDLGTQNAPMMSPEYIHRYLAPRYKKMWEYTHSHSNAYTFMHCCGSIAPLLGDLIDAGLDIINPVQTTAHNMDPEQLKREFGKDIVFWGGACEVQGVMSLGTPQEVRDQVKRRIEIFGKDGGFICTQIHNALPGVPAENIVAMYDTAYEYGWYR